MGVSACDASGLEGPLSGCSFSLALLSRERTETRVENPVQSQGMESYSPDLPEPSSERPEACSISTPTHRPPPTQLAGRTVHAAEPPAGGATGPAATGCCRVEPQCAHVRRKFPSCSLPTNQNYPSERRVPPPAFRPANWISRAAIGRISDIKGAREMFGSARGDMDHQGAPQSPTCFFYCPRRMYLGCGFLSK